MLTLARGKVVSRDQAFTGTEGMGQCLACGVPKCPACGGLEWIPHNSLVDTGRLAPVRRSVSLTGRTLSCNLVLFRRREARVAQFLAMGMANRTLRGWAELLQNKNREPGISGARDVHGNAVVTVAVQQVHGKQRRNEAILLHCYEH